MEPVTDTGALKEALGLETSEKAQLIYRTETVTGGMLFQTSKSHSFSGPESVPQTLAIYREHWPRCGVGAAGAADSGRHPSPLCHASRCAHAGAKHCLFQRQQRFDLQDNLMATSWSSE